MDIFEDKRFAWDGVDYVIPARSVLEAIARVEQHVTLAELLSYGTRRTIPAARLAFAYGELIRFAGGDVTDDEVYAGMFAAMVGAPEHAGAIVTACAGLIQLLVPKSKGAPVLARGEEPPALGNSPKSASKPGSRSAGSGRSSAPAGVPRKSSGNSRRRSST